MGAKRKSSPAHKPDSRPCSYAGSDHLLEAARHGWGVTIRYAILMTVTRWPLVVYGTGAATLAGYARARGWI